MKKILCFLSVFLVTGMLPVSAAAQAQVEEVMVQADEVAIIEDIKIDLIQEYPEIKIASNIAIECLDYTLDSPSRIIVDPLGIVYSNLDENIFSGDDLVQSITIVKGRGELPGGLDRTYYPLDFVIIELKKAVYYDILRQEKLVVKLGDEVLQPVFEIPEATVEIVEVGLEEAPEVGEEFYDTEKFPLIGKYRIEAGDELEVSVWQHPDLLRKMLVRPDGYISFPIAGDVRVQGSTADMAARDVALRLCRLLRNPEVNVIVSGFGSKSIYVLGAVDDPGLYPYTTEMTVLKAVTEAGSWETHAYIRNVVVVRKFFSGNAEVLKVDLWDIVKEGRVEKDIKIQPGDIVYVPKSVLGNMKTFLDVLKTSFSIGGSYSFNP